MLQKPTFQTNTRNRLKDNCDNITMLSARNGKHKSFYVNSLQGNTNRVP